MSEPLQQDAFILHVNSCLTPYERIHNASIMVRGGFIQAVGGHSAFSVLDDIPAIRLPDCDAIPGMIDTHLHGSGGFAAMSADIDNDLAAMSRVLAERGVTSFVPAVLSAEREKMMAVTAALVRALDRDHPGAVPVGIHLEGPYLSQEKRGTQSPRAIRPVDLGELDELLAAGEGRVRIMTFAPELKESHRLVERLREENVSPSMGHSMAEAEVVLRAIEVGACRCTHFYNGMPPLDRRRVGLTAVALTDDRVTIELIADGVHVHPRMIDLVCRAKPPHLLVTVSDAVQGAGLPEGVYQLGEDRIQITDGSSRRVADGKLAGSCLGLDHAMRNLRSFTALSDAEAVASCSHTPALSIGLTDRGAIQPGLRADIVVLDDAQEIQMTVVEGRIVYDKRGAGQLGEAVYA